MTEQIYKQKLKELDEINEVLLLTEMKKARLIIDCLKYETEQFKKELNETENKIRETIS